MDTHVDEGLCERFHWAVELIGRRWTGAIIYLLLTRTHRFSDLAAGIPGISDRLLSERLKELEAEGIVERSVIPDTPVRVEYCLTAKGRELEPALHAIQTWAETWLPEPEAEDAATPSTQAAGAVST